MNAGSRCILTGDAIDPAAELARFSQDAPGAGAVASFTGLMRPLSAAGDTLDALVLEAHPRLTLPSLEGIGAAVWQAFDLVGLRIVHRHGTIMAGEAIVFVAAAAVHRRAAFDAVDAAMDRLKTDAVLWKREDGVGGSRWIEPRPADLADRARWG